MDWTPEPLIIEPGARTFEANGKKYHKASTISFRRYGLMEVWNMELAFGRTPDQLFKTERDAFDLLNKMKFAEAAVLLDNSMRGLARIADQSEIVKRTHPAMKLTMLFWNSEGEDVGSMTDELMSEKLSDMEKAGVDASFFFAQALANVPGFLENYKKSSPNGSTQDGATASEGG